MNKERILYSLIICIVIFAYSIIFAADNILMTVHSDEYIKLGFAVENNTLYNLRLVEKGIGRKVDIFHIFQKINETPKTETIQDALDRGYIVLLTIEPWEGYDKNHSIYIPSSILNGSIDDHIEKWNNTLNLLDYKKGKLIIRVCHEMNADWYPWGAFWKNNTINDSVDEYVYIINKLKNDRLMIMWGINRKTFGYKDIWMPWDRLYPGDEYVDIIGISGYNRRKDNWMNFSDIYDSVYNDTLKFNKTIWIAEISSISEGGDKAKWISDTFYQVTHNYSRIDAIVWFDENKVDQRDVMDWAFDSTEESGIAFKESVKFENMKKK